MLFIHHLFWNKTFGARHMTFTGEIPLSVIQPTVLKHRKKQNSKIKSTGDEQNVKLQAQMYTVSTIGSSHYSGNKKGRYGGK